MIGNLRPPDLSQQFLYEIGSDSRMINYERLFDKITDNYYNVWGVSNSWGSRTCKVYIGKKVWEEYVCVREGIERKERGRE